MRAFPTFRLMSRSLLSLETLHAEDMLEILATAKSMKTERGRHREHPLRHQCWGLIFTKSSTRTRVSFEVAIREFGGDPIFMSANDLQLGRGEPIRDTARVLGRMLHGIVIRTFAQSDIEELAKCSGLPVINALTDEEHPCQILADIFTIGERLGDWRGKRVCFLGDGSCNVPVSWLWAAAKLGFELVIGAPPNYRPAEAVLARLGQPANIRFESEPRAAVQGADVVYTDVWVSMGKEAESAERLAELRPWQLNAELMEFAKPGAIVLHCLPAYRGQEITEDVLERHSDAIFTQAENRLHVQKAVLAYCVG